MWRSWIVVIASIVGLILFSAALAQGGQNTYLPIALNGEEPTPTPTMPPQSGGVVTQPNTTYYEGESGSLVFFGEVENQTQQLQVPISFSIDLLQNGNVVAALTYTHDQVGYLLPNTKDCFAVGGDAGPYPPFDSYIIHNPTYHTLYRPVVPLRVEEVTITLESANRLMVQGVIHNDEENAVTEGEAKITLYDGNDRVVGCSTLYPDNYFTIAEGESLAFEERFSVRSDYSDVVRAEVQAAGIPMTLTAPPPSTRPAP